MVDQNLECNLAYSINSNIGILVEWIIRFESSDHPLVNSIQIVADFQNKIQQIQNDKRRAIQLKMKKALDENTDFDTICTISKILDVQIVSQMTSV